MQPSEISSEREFHLVGGTDRPEHGYREAALGAGEKDLLVRAGELAGLAEHLLDYEFGSLAVEDLDGFGGEVDVSC